MSFPHLRKVFSKSTMEAPPNQSFETDTSPTIALWHSMTVNRAGTVVTPRDQYRHYRPKDETAIAVLVAIVVTVFF